MSVCKTNWFPGDLSDYSAINPQKGDLASNAFIKMKQNSLSLTCTTRQIDGSVYK